MAASFKTTHTFEARLDEARRIKEKFPGRVPIIVERAAKSSSDLPVIDKNKFLVPGDLTVSQFVFVVRKRLALSPEQSLCVRLALLSLARAGARHRRAPALYSYYSLPRRFLFVSGSLPTTGTLLRELYANFCDADGFLYALYAAENTFGGAA
jgi:GABA(A) receptor-associated protein